MIEKKITRSSLSISFAANEQYEDQRLDLNWKAVTPDLKLETLRKLTYWPGHDISIKRCYATIDIKLYIFEIPYNNKNIIYNIDDINMTLVILLSLEPLDLYVGKVTNTTSSMIQSFNIYSTNTTLERISLLECECVMNTVLESTGNISSLNYVTVSEPYRVTTGKKSWVPVNFLSNLNVNYHKK